jgi:anti-anti-sigma regulatory factor
MSVVRVEHIDGARVIHVEGCATDDDLRQALTSLRDPAGPTVLDLAELTLVGSGVAELVAGLVETCGAVCVTARRHTARKILQRSGIPDLCMVFTSVGDALQALRLAEAGYGAGWAEHMEGAR